MASKMLSIPKRFLANNVLFVKGVKRDADFEKLIQLDCFRNAVAYKPVQDMPGQSERKGDLGYMTFKSESDKLNAIVRSDPKLNMLSGKGAQFDKKGLTVAPHDPHEMLNFSKVSGSGLTAKDFIEQGIPNVDEVFEFPKYGKGGEIITTGSSTYNVRFNSVENCANWWKSVKSGEVKPVLNNILCKVQIYKEAEKVQLDKKFKRKALEAKRGERRNSREDRA
jgi:hypothetical protein